MANSLKACVWCQAPLAETKHGGGTRKFCNRNCSNRYYYWTKTRKRRSWRAVMEPGVCPQCQKSFTRTNPLQLYCSSHCRRSYWRINQRALMGDPREPATHCFNCHAVLLRTSDGRGGANKMYCNARCKHQWHRRFNREYQRKRRERALAHYHLTHPFQFKWKRKCEACGKEFETMRRTKLYCEPECKVKRAKQRKHYLPGASGRRSAAPVPREAREATSKSFRAFRKLVRFALDAVELAGLIPLQPPPPQWPQPDPRSESQSSEQSGPSSGSPASLPPPLPTGSGQTYRSEGAR